jgi:hypothetical protein
VIALLTELKLPALQSDGSQVYSERFNETAAMKRLAQPISNLLHLMHDRHSRRTNGILESRFQSVLNGAQMSLADQGSTDSPSATESLQSGSRTTKNAETDRLAHAFAALMTLNECSHRVHENVRFGGQEPSIVQNRSERSETTCSNNGWPGGAGVPLFILGQEGAKSFQTTSRLHWGKASLVSRIRKGARRFSDRNNPRQG